MGEVLLTCRENLALKSPTLEDLIGLEIESYKSIDI